MGDDFVVKVSVIIPVYNSEKFIKDCLESILNQTYKDFEIIIVNDGSTDNSENIIMNYLQDDRVQYYCIKNEGVSSARNFGILKSKGEYISFVDSDDIVDKHFLEIMIRELEKNDSTVSFIASSFNTFSELNAITKTEIPPFVDTRLYGENSISELVLNSNIQGFVWNKVYRKSALNNIKFSNEISAHEDLEFNINILIETPSFVYINLPLYNYRVNSMGLMFSDAFDKRKLTAIDMYNKLFNNFQFSKKDFINLKSHFGLVCMILCSNIIKSRNDLNYRRDLEQIYCELKLNKKYIISKQWALKYKIGYFLFNIHPLIFEKTIIFFNKLENIK